MIFILDDQFELDMIHGKEYLNEVKYQRVCKIFTKIKTIELSQIIKDKDLDNCKLFCNHKTLKIYDLENNPVALEENLKYRESLLNKIDQKHIQRVEFSGGLESNPGTNKISRKEFYKNLKQFLDYYLEKGHIELKILYFGVNFKKQEKLKIIDNLCRLIKNVDIDKYCENREIIDGLNYIYEKKDIKKIIEGWTNSQKSKNDIITEIKKFGGID